MARYVAGPEWDGRTPNVNGTTSTSPKAEDIRCVAQQLVKTQAAVRNLMQNSTEMPNLREEVAELDSRIKRLHEELLLIAVPDDLREQILAVDARIDSLDSRSRIDRLESEVVRLAKAVERVKVEHDSFLIALRKDFDLLRTFVRGQMRDMRTEVRRRACMCQGTASEATDSQSPKTAE